MPGADFTGIPNLGAPVAGPPIVPPDLFSTPPAGLTDLGNENRQAIRGTLEWEPSNDLRVTLFADYSRIRENNAPNRLIAITGDEDAIIDGQFVPAPARGAAVFIFNQFDAPNLAAPFGLPNSLVTDANFVTGDDTTFGTAQPTGTQLDAFGISGTIDYDITDTLRVKSITAYRDTSGAFNRDADGTPFPITATYNFDYNHEQFSQEIQLIGELFNDRLKWILGGYFFTETGSDPAFVDLPDAFGDVFVPGADIDNQSFAAFAQATFDLTDRLSVTGGIRFTRDEKTFFADNVLVLGTAAGEPGNPFFPPGAGFVPGLIVPLVDILALPEGRPRGVQRADQEFNDVSPRVSIQYEATDDLLFYGSYSQGFKSGGANARYVAPSPGIETFEPENVDAFEIGFKFEGFGRRLRLNGAGFFTDYEDIQITFFEALGAPLTINGGAAEIFGAELELVTLPVENLTLSFSAGYTDAQYTSLVPVDPTSISTPEQVITLDSQLQNTPEWSLNTAVDYVIPNALFGGDIELHADWRFTDDVFNDAQNSPFLFQEAYHLVNLGATYFDASNRWSLRLWVENVANERYIVSGDSNFGLGFHQANFNRPREFGATLRVNF